MKTEKLIENLVKDSSSVKPILSTPIVFLFWLLASLSFLILFVWSRSNELNTLHSPEKSYEIIPILISIFFSGYASIHLSIPGNRLRPIFLSIPFFLFLIWFLLIYSKYLLSPESPKLDFEFHGCIQDLLWMTIPSFIILFYIINKRIPINKTWIGYLLLTASSSIGAIGVLLLCPDETFYHLVKVHFSPIFTLSLSGFLIGKIILKHPI